MLAVLLVLVVLVMGLGFVAGVVAEGGWWRGDGAGPWIRDRGGQGRGSPGPLFALVAMVAIVGSIATARAYRRLSRPVGELLDAAERVAGGDYEVAVQPDGPRELRLLTATFNDMATRLAHTEEQRRRFLADVTHELRTPLAVLQGGIEAQLDGIHPRDDAHLASLLEETQRLGHLVDDLHTLALADAGRLTLHREHWRPAALVEDAVADHAPLAARKEVAVHATIADDLPEVEVDPTRFRQILDNLLSNAIRHTPAGGVVGVEVRAVERASQVRVTVTDAGPGFPPERLARLFDRSAPPGDGSRAGSSGAADSGGSGLGLAIVADLVRAHGGTVRAENPRTGGAAVSFTVPAAPAAS